ncbi:CPBP family intramembrane glutamic endopeptidase [Mycolicibacterium brumae]|uniref:CPBP family intramembrane glutamic endopeptidase n=1 Tax=Mycolicibacterium brumae TaxID=85968 RepID=UPI001F3A7FED|nr:CPBP family intramembrane glutamic endopeptidase [Mycolicibacterium brumae]UWW10635.1 CPBP family intramembrane metalloprotease [Mycolicibacterium brumae]
MARANVSPDGGARSRAGAMVSTAGMCVYLAALVTVAVAGEGRIRYTADSDDTIPMWHPLLAAAVGVMLIQLTPGAAPAASTTPRHRAGFDAVTLLGLATGFTISLTLLGADDANYLVLKVALLVVAPMLLFAAGRRREAAQHTDIEVPQTQSHRWWALTPTLGWVATFMALSRPQPAGGFEADVVTIAAAVIFGFVINAVVEEFFYRRWLQSRWQLVLGGVWPAIVISSLAWASWHIAIQGTGDLPLDLANVVANQGITGIFLGLLWQRYKVMWPLLVAHGVMNANPIAFI